MTLNKIVLVQNDGKNGALFNAFLGLLNIESEVNKALGDEDYPIGGFSNVWLSPNPDPGVLLQDMDKVAAMSVLAYRNEARIYAFEYHQGTLLFGPYIETSLLARLNAIKENLYAGFGKAYLKKLESQVSVSPNAHRYNIDMYVGGGWSFKEFALGGMGPLCSVTMIHKNGDSRQIGVDLDKGIFLSDTPGSVQDDDRTKLIERINQERREMYLEHLNKEKAKTVCGAV